MFVNVKINRLINCSWCKVEYGISDFAGHQKVCHPLLIGRPLFTQPCQAKTPTLEDDALLNELNRFIIRDKSEEEKGNQLILPHKKFILNYAPKYHCSIYGFQKLRKDEEKITRRIETVCVFEDEVLKKLMPEEPQMKKSDVYDIRDKKFQLGHIIKAVSTGRDYDSRLATYISTNFIAVKATVNNGVWDKIEHHEQNVYDNSFYSEVFSVTGNIWEGKCKEIKGRRVPSSLFVVIICGSDVGLIIQCFVVPNEDGCTGDIFDYKSNIKDIERRAGIRFTEEVRNACLVWDERGQEILKVAEDATPLQKGECRCRNCGRRFPNKQAYSHHIKQMHSNNNAKKSKASKKKREEDDSNEVTTPPQKNSKQDEKSQLKPLRKWMREKLNDMYTEYKEQESLPSECCELPVKDFLRTLNEVCENAVTRLETNK